MPSPFFEFKYKVSSELPVDLVRATNLPQAQTGQFRLSRVSAGFRGPFFCGKTGLKEPVSFHIFLLSL